MGKWHLGEWLPEHLPMRQGFDHQYGHYAWGLDYNNYTIPHNAPAVFCVYDWHRNQQPMLEQGYTTDLIANEAVRLLAEHDRQRPFFPYIAFNAIHGPLEEIPRHTATLDKRSAAIKCLDEVVGRILGTLEHLGLAEDTLVIFTNDNGGLTEEVNRPYRGTKNTTYEGGIRVPFIARRPGRLAPGAVNDELVHDRVAAMKLRLQEASAERPQLCELLILMEPALPYVYGRDETANVPTWFQAQRPRAMLCGITGNALDDLPPMSKRSHTAIEDPVLLGKKLFDGSQDRTTEQ